tara:strand:- start:4260 stop:4841 length:582 start_codon:yes stop_codon:yes gene_type:complete
MSIETKQDNMSRKIHLGISPLRQEVQPMSYSNASTRRNTTPTDFSFFNVDPNGNYSPSDTHVAGAYPIGEPIINEDGIETQTVVGTSDRSEIVNEALNDAKKGYKEGAFENDGRSRDKFNSRIAKATDEGRYGKAKRLKNRKANYMSNQADKWGGDFSSDEGKKIYEDAQKARKESEDVGGGTGFGKFLRKTF